MLDVDKLKFNLQEANYPYFSQEELLDLLEMYPNVNQASYEGCMLKSADDSVSLGPISTPNNSAYWVRMARKYLAAYKSEMRSSGRQGGNFSMMRSDER